MVKMTDKIDTLHANSELQSFKRTAPKLPSKNPGYVKLLYYFLTIYFVVINSG